MIMTKVYWTLGGLYENYDEFVRDVSEYNKQIAPDDNEWNPDEVICEGPVRIQFEAMWRDEDDFLNVLIEGENKPVTMGRLLFTLHNESKDFFADVDHHFFEGLSLIEAGVYRLHIGS